MAVGEQTAQQSPISNEQNFSNWTVLFNGKWVPMPAFMDIQSVISTSVALFAFNLFFKNNHQDFGTKFQRGYG